MEIVRLLARQLQRDQAGLEAELSAAGSALPVDSLASIEILLEVEEMFGVRLPDDEATASALRSVHGLARRVCQVRRSA